MFNEYKDGWLKMLDIESFNDALKSKWLKYLMTTIKQNGNVFDFFTKRDSTFEFFEW